MRIGKGLTMMCLLVWVTCFAQHVSGGIEPEQVPPPAPATEMSPRRAHGTIVVIVSAKDGYALAADSRLTLENERGQVVGRRDDGQKLFPIGKFTACVVAGNVSSAAPGDGFVLESSVATEMATTDQILARSAGLAESMDARQFATFFQTRLTVILGLLDADVTFL